MTKDEVLDLVLDWLVCYKDKSMSRNNAEDLAEELITAIKQARSAPVQEPVAWTVSGKITDWSKDFSAYQTKHYTRPVYTPPAAPVQEPAIKQGWDVDTLLDKPAAQRQWTGLTDEERNKIRFDYLDYDERARAIEAKLKEKNT